MGGNLLRQETKKINDHEVIVTAFTALLGLKLKGRLLKFIGPAFGQIIKSVDPKKGIAIMDSDVSMQLLGQAIQGLSEKLDDPGVIELIIDMLAYTQYDGIVLNRETINMKFAADYMVLYKVLLFVVDANRFFGERSIGEMFGNMTDTPLPNS